MALDPRVRRAFEAMGNPAPTSSDDEIRVTTTTYKADSAMIALEIIAQLEAGEHPFILVVPTQGDENTLAINAIFRNQPTEEGALLSLIYLGADAVELLQGGGNRINDWDDPID